MIIQSVIELSQMCSLEIYQLLTEFNLQWKWGKLLFGTLFKACETRDESGDSQ